MGHNQSISANNDNVHEKLLETQKILERDYILPTTADIFHNLITTTTQNDTDTLQNQQSLRFIKSKVLMLDTKLNATYALAHTCISYLLDVKETNDKTKHWRNKDFIHREYTNLDKQYLEIFNVNHLKKFTKPKFKIFSNVILELLVISNYQIDALCCICRNPTAMNLLIADTKKYHTDDTAITLSDLFLCMIRNPMQHAALSYTLNISIFCSFKAK